jgi:hypothetical protein
MFYINGRLVFEFKTSGSQNKLKESIMFESLTEQELFINMLWKNYRKINETRSINILQYTKRNTVIRQE